jgi:hypothetical protein
MTNPMTFSGVAAKTAATGWSSIPTGSGNSRMPEGAADLRSLLESLIVSQDTGDA